MYDFEFFAVRDPVLNAYVRKVLCRTIGDAHCAPIRLYIIRTSQFNASMAPNGMMQVWTGLLLRMDNEAQLATVLGHEMGHAILDSIKPQLWDAASMEVAAFHDFRKSPKVPVALADASAAGFRPGDAPGAQRPRMGRAVRERREEPRFFRAWRRDIVRTSTGWMRSWMHRRCEFSSR